MMMEKATTSPGFMRPRGLAPACAGLIALVGACTGKIGDASQDVGGMGPNSGSPTAPGTGGPRDNGTPPPPFSPSEPALARLTAPQYANVIRDLFGAGLQISELEPDQRPYLFSVIGASTTTVSEHGVDLYGQSAFSVAKAVFSDATRRQALVPCQTGAGPLADTCLGQFITQFGQRAWRRPLETTEVARYKALGSAIGLTDAWVALQYVTAAMLQSPNFLYRVELGEPDPGHPGWLHYTGYEMASRLSFLLRNSFPDAELFAAAGRGELVTQEGVLAQANRLLADAAPTQEMISQLYSEYLDLPLLSDVQFPMAMDPNHTIGVSMRNEVVDIVNRIALRQPDDMRTLFTTQTIAVNSELATLYGLTSPSASALQPAQLPADGPRAGILTTGALLTLNNRPNRTSPTIRGLFIRQRLLCGTVPPPPAGIPPLSDDSSGPPKTIREKLEAHRANPTCAACHRSMDPIGLGMEDFDQFGRHRTMYDTGQVVDDGGDLDGATFNGARQLGALLAKDERMTSCMVTQFYRYGSSRLEANSEELVLTNLDQAFAKNGYQLKPLLLELVGSDGFRYLVPEAK
jgi:Protein of unknown function (DUF1588)/Protein of unknown function (DUF1592)/Protein of unknown function (DUF1595)/Protein of unknown function (DUF1585)/Protein of unknown function (DUF1587)